MNSVNFLPESYRKDQQRRGRFTRQVMLVAAVALCLMVWGVGLKLHGASQRTYAQQMEDTVQSELGKLVVMADLEREHATLIQQIKTERGLVEPVEMAQVIAMIGESLPAELAVSELVVNAVRPSPEPLLEKKANARRSKKKAGQDEDQSPPHYLSIELVGVAPSDMSVANFIFALDEHPLFSRVQLNSSRGVEHAGLLAREFTMSAQIQLDCDIRWNNAEGEVAHVD